MFIDVVGSKLCNKQQSDIKKEITKYLQSLLFDQHY